TRNYDPAATLVAPGTAQARGAAAVEQAYTALLADPNFKIAMEPGEGWASESGELAVTAATGSVTLTDAASGRPVTLPIANQTVWRREDGVGWKIVAEHNAALPPVAGGG
ncbi:MAG TPA: nuclear transport factor 2 family protein, partial [Croceibacterium sp.]